MKEDGNERQLTIKANANAEPFEVTVKKSKFITNFARVNSVQGAKVFVEQVRSIHKGATHNCWAFLIQEGVMGYSDDGEPHQTAGAPMLNVLDKWNMREVAVVVTRYYGGVKLGTGGLIRAYSGSVVDALSAMELVEFVQMVGLMVQMNYSAVDGFQYLLRQYDDSVRIVSKSFDEGAVFIVEIKHPSVAKFIADAYAMGVESIEVYE